MEQTIQNGVINQIYQTEKKLSQFFVIIVFRLYEHTNGGIYQDNLPEQYDVCQAM